MGHVVVCKTCRKTKNDRVMEFVFQSRYQCYQAFFLRQRLAACCACVKLTLMTLSQSMRCGALKQL